MCLTFKSRSFHLQRHLACSVEVTITIQTTQVEYLWRWRQWVLKHVRSDLNSSCLETIRVTFIFVCVCMCDTIGLVRNLKKSNWKHRINMCYLGITLHCLLKSDSTQIVTLGSNEAGKKWLCAIVEILWNILTSYYN